MLPTHFYQLIVVAALYLVSAFLPVRWRAAGYVTTILGLLLHACALTLEVYTNNVLRMGFAVVLSATMWMSVTAYLIENRQGVLDSLRVLLLPVAAVAVLLPGFFPGGVVELADKSGWFVWHIIVSLLAYSTLTIAAFHAVLMVMQEARLQPARSVRKDTWFAMALDRLPALLSMEKILFRLINIGFVLLSLTMFSGVIFAEKVLGRAFTWDHKAVLSLLSWLLFAILIIGRKWRGWRGKTALRVTIAGFVGLLLAYIGSRFVLEVVLHRVS